jgi:hypothetical protein
MIDAKYVRARCSPAPGLSAAASSLTVENRESFAGIWIADKARAPKPQCSTRRLRVSFFR